MLLLADLLGVLALFVLAMLPVDQIQRTIAPWPNWTVIPVFAAYTVWIGLAAGTVGFVWELIGGLSW